MSRDREGRRDSLPGSALPEGAIWQRRPSLPGHLDNPLFNRFVTSPDVNEEKHQGPPNTSQQPREHHENILVLPAQSASSPRRTSMTASGVPVSPSALLPTLKREKISSSVVGHDPSRYRSGGESVDSAQSLGISDRPECSARCRCFTSILSGSIVRIILVAVLVALAGAAFVLQAAVTIQLSSALGHGLFASFVCCASAMSVSLVAAVAAHVNSGRAREFVPQLRRSVYWSVWIAGRVWIAGAVTAFCVCTCVIVPPYIGMTSVFVCVALGQIVSFTVLSHFGAVGVNMQRIRIRRAFGVAMMFGSVVLIQDFSSLLHTPPSVTVACYVVASMAGCALALLAALMQQLATVFLSTFRAACVSLVVASLILACAGGVTLAVGVSLTFSVSWDVWWEWTGGASLVFAFICMVSLPPMIGISFWLTLSTIGQLLMAFLIESLGALGLPAVDFSWQRMGAVGCGGVGCLLVLSNVLTSRHVVVARNRSFDPSDALWPQMVPLPPSPRHAVNLIAVSKVYTELSSPPTPREAPSPGKAVVVFDYSDFVNRCTVDQTVTRTGSTVSASDARRSSSSDTSTVPDIGCLPLVRISGRKPSIDVRVAEPSKQSVPERFESPFAAHPPPSPQRRLSSIPSCRPLNLPSEAIPHDHDHEHAVIHDRESSAGVHAHGSGTREVIVTSSPGHGTTSAFAAASNNILHSSALNAAARVADVKYLHQQVADFTSTVALPSRYDVGPAGNQSRQDEDLGI